MCALFAFFGALLLIFFFISLLRNVLSHSHLLCDASIRQTGVVKDDWQMSLCAKKLISVSPDTSVLRACGQVQKKAISQLPLCNKHEEGPC